MTTIYEPQKEERCHVQRIPTTAGIQPLVLGRSPGSCAHYEVSGFYSVTKERLDLTIEQAKKIFGSGLSPGILTGVLNVQTQKSVIPLLLENGWVELARFVNPIHKSTCALYGFFLGERLNIGEEKKKAENCKHEKRLVECECCCSVCGAFGLEIPPKKARG